MPTTRRRHFVTETDAVAAALDDAALRWPEDRDSRARLVVRLLEEGHRKVLADRVDRRARWDAVVERTSGSLTGCYEPDYLDTLRGEWPE